MGLFRNDVRLRFEENPFRAVITGTRRSDGEKVFIEYTKSKDGSNEEPVYFHRGALSLKYSLGRSDRHLLDTFLNYRNQPNSPP